MKQMYSSSLHSFTVSGGGKKWKRERGGEYLDTKGDLTKGEGKKRFVVDPAISLPPKKQKKEGKRTSGSLRLKVGKRQSTERVKKGNKKRKKGGDATVSTA